MVGLLTPQVQRYRQMRGGEHAPLTGRNETPSAQKWSVEEKKKEKRKKNTQSHLHENTRINDLHVRHHQQYVSVSPGQRDGAAVGTEQTGRACGSTGFRAARHVFTA